MNDMISRQAAMEEISKQQTYKMFEGEDVLYLNANDVGSVLASLPSAQPEQRWIPCGDRLPKENVYVLVWCGGIEIARIIRGISKEQRAKMKEGIIDDPVSYGMNLSNGYFKVKRSESYRACDENGNNKVPYCWDCIYGKMFGQDVKAWMPLPEPWKEEKENG